MKIEVGIKFEVVETVELEWAEYVEGEVYVVYQEVGQNDGLNFRTRETSKGTTYINLGEVLQEAFEEGKFKLLEEGKEMEKQNDFGLVAGDKVKCISNIIWFKKGEIYEVGIDGRGDFGVLDSSGTVPHNGVIEWVDGSKGDFSFKDFEKVVEQPVEEQVEVKEQLTPESKVTIEGKRYKLVRDLPEINEVEVGDFIKILSGKEDADYSDNGYSLEAGDILKVSDIDEECGRATLRCIKLIGEGSFEDGYIYNRALEDNFEIVEVEVTVKEK